MLQKEANGKWESNNIKTSPDLWCQQTYCGTKINQTQKDSGTEVTCSGIVMKLTLCCKMQILLPKNM